MQCCESVMRASLRIRHQKGHQGVYRSAGWPPIGPRFRAAAVALLISRVRVLLGPPRCQNDNDLPANSHLLPIRSLLASLPAPGADSDRRRAVRLTTVVSARHLSAALGGRHIPSVDRRWTSRLSAPLACCCGDRRTTTALWLREPPGVLLERVARSPTMTEVFAHSRLGGGTSRASPAGEVRGGSGRVQAPLPVVDASTLSSGVVKAIDWLCK